MLTRGYNFVRGQHVYVWVCEGHDSWQQTAPMYGQMEEGCAARIAGMVIKISLDIFSEAAGRAPWLVTVG